MEKVSVLVADQNSLISDGICAILENCESIDVVGAVTKNEDIFRTMAKKDPDIVVIDIDLSLKEGAETIRRIRHNNSGTKVLFISEHEDRDRILRGFKAGGNGYIPKRATSSELVTAIMAVHRGGYFLYPSIAKTMVSEYLRIKQGLSPDPYDELSTSEKELLKLIAEGRKNSQIAETLNTLLNTVIKKKASIMTKLGLHNRTELIKYAIRKHLIEL